MPVGRYTRLDEIGRGSFATVYQGVHTVCTFSPPYRIDEQMLISLFALEITHLCRHQVGQPVEAQPEAEGESLLRDSDPQGSLPSSYRRSHRLP